MARVIENLVVRLDNVWTQYPDSVFKGLQDMYAKGHDCVEMVITSDPELKYMHFLTKFRIDFVNLTQTNVHTQKTHKIRIVPVGSYATMKGALSKIYPVASNQPTKASSGGSQKTPCAQSETLAGGNSSRVNASIPNSSAASPLASMASVRSGVTNTTA